MLPQVRATIFMLHHLYLDRSSGPQSSQLHLLDLMGLGGHSAAGTQNTSDTRITLKALEAGSLYTLTIWAERNKIRGYPSTLTEATGVTLSSFGLSPIGMGQGK
jgi:hypothetical protein